MRAAARLGIVGLVILAAGLPAYAVSNLTPDQIKAEFATGKPFHGVAVPGGRRWEGRDDLPQ